MVPESESSSPVSCPISVVLPAPFGPMTACNSPRVTSSESASLATIPPKRFDRPSTWSSGSAMPHLFQKSIDAAAGEDDDKQQHGAQNDRPIFRCPHRRVAEKRQTGKLDQQRQSFLQHQQRDGA